MLLAFAVLADMTRERWEAPMRHRYAVAVPWVGLRLRAVSLLLGALLLVLAACSTSTATKNNVPAATPTATASGPLAGVVAPVARPLAQRIVTEYDTSAQQAKITLTVGAAPDVATAQVRVKTLSFQVQKAVWASRPALHEVKVIVLGPIRDDYANIIDDAYGVSDVLAPTAAKLSWSALTPESAWSRYDSTWLRPSYSPNWLYGKNN
jgi:hypothetical protein